MTGIVVTGGEAPEFKYIESIFKDSFYLIAADSGLDFCLENKLKPDYIIGDMDSLKNQDHLRFFKEEIIERHSEEKDYTDTELALHHVYGKECSPVILIGGGGGRADHFLAVYSLFFRKKRPDYWITHNSFFSLIHRSISIHANVGDQISLFPLSEECRMTSRGLYWPLDELCWQFGDTGISNRAIEKTVEIHMKKGSLIMVQDLDSAKLP